ncbi:MAG: flagellar hook assembly protein FlgD [Oligoflexia bacterium]|nr:flagellar hook assembly protein FlgD [Oligoflexia bacterium]
MEAIGNNTAAMQALANPGHSVSATGGGPNGVQEDTTAPQFGDVLKKMQSQYGAKAEKPREIKKTLGKDDFLRIMITQMRHQDPTNPFKAEQMAQEMAQFTSVEQLQNLNQSMAKMAQQNQPLERLAMTNLIGKTVTVDRDRFAHVEGQNEALTYRLPKDAANVHLAIISEAGEVVLEKDIGEQKAGEGTFAWDGLKSNTLSAKTGGYILRVEAKDERGASIQTDPQKRVRVVGVSFEGGEPVLLVGDNRRQEKVGLKTVVRIEGELPAGAAPEAASSSSIPAQSAPNFFSFQKGVGSATLDSLGNPDLAAALSKSQPPAAGAQAAPRAVPAATDEAKGFPNGLSGNDNGSTTDEAQAKGGENG